MTIHIFFLLIDLNKLTLFCVLFSLKFSFVICCYKRLLKSESYWLSLFNNLLKRFLEKGWKSVTRNRGNNLYLISGIVG